MVHMKRRLFLSTALVEPKPKLETENRYECKGKELQCKIHYAKTICGRKEEKDKCPQSTEQCQSCGGVVCREHSLTLHMQQCLKQPHQKYLHISKFLPDFIDCFKTITYSLCNHYKHLRKSRYIFISNESIYSLNLLNKMLKEENFGQNLIF